jgi:hypothetical protein
VFFKSSDSPFSGVAAVAVGGNQLICHVIGSEKVFQSGGCFVVKGLKFGFETLRSEFLIDVIICFDPLRGGPGLHWDNFEIIVVINITYHGLRVALAGPHPKFSRQIRVKLSLVDQDGINELVFVPELVLVVVISSMSDAIGALEVDLMFWSLLFMCPIVVAGVRFKCLLIAFSVRPGQVMRCPFLTACNKADVVGLNRALCK